MIQQNGRLQLHEGKWVWFIMGVTNAFDPSCPSFSCEIDLSMLLEFEQVVIAMHAAAARNCYFSSSLTCEFQAAGGTWH